MTQTALEDAEAALGAMGFARDTRADPGLPARLVLRDEVGRHVDLHPLLFDEQGNGWQELGDDTWGLYPTDGSQGWEPSAAWPCAASPPSFSSATISAGA
jgi:Aminoglycoside-2''-adenylyltransferase